MPDPGDGDAAGDRDHEHDRDRDHDCDRDRPPGDPDGHVSRKAAAWIRKNWSVCNELPTPADEPFARYSTVVSDAVRANFGAMAHRNIVVTAEEQWDATRANYRWTWRVPAQIRAEIADWGERRAQSHTDNPLPCDCPIFRVDNKRGGGIVCLECHQEFARADLDRDRPGQAEGEGETETSPGPGPATAADGGTPAETGAGTDTDASQTHDQANQTPTQTTTDATDATDAPTARLTPRETPGHAAGPESETESESESDSESTDDARHDVHDDRID